MTKTIKGLKLEIKSLRTKKRNLMKNTEIPYDEARPQIIAIDMEIEELTNDLDLLKLKRNELITSPPPPMGGDGT